MPSQFTVPKLQDCHGSVESILSSNTCISYRNFCKSFLALSPSRYMLHNSYIDLNGTDNNICFPHECRYAFYPLNFVKV